MFLRQTLYGPSETRLVVETIRAAGFEIIQLEHDMLRKAPPIVRPLVVGIAQANGRPAQT